MIRFFVFIYSLVFFLCSSCGSDVVSIQPDPYNSYFPLTIGSTWRYYSTSTDRNQLYTVQGDTVIAGIQYKKVLVTADGNASSHTICMRNIGSGISFPQPDPLSGMMRDVVLLKDNVQQGDLWSYETLVEGLPFFYESICEGIGSSIKINSTTYYNVIKITTAFGPIVNNQRTSRGVITYYYSKGVGIIHKITSVGNLPTESILLQYYTLH